MSNTIRVFDYFQSNGRVNDFQKWFPEKRKQLWLRTESTFSKYVKSYTCFRLLSLKWERLRPPKMVFRKPEAVIIASRINIFEKFQIFYLFSTIFWQMEGFTTSRNGFQKAVITSFQINIFEKFQILYVFSTIVSQMEAFMTSKIGFEKTWSSWNFVPN